MPPPPRAAVPPRPTTPTGFRSWAVITTVLVVVGGPLTMALLFALQFSASFCEKGADRLVCRTESPVSTLAQIAPWAGFLTGLALSGLGGALLMVLGRRPTWAAVAGCVVFALVALTAFSWG